jgi:hypothetical protein
METMTYRPEPACVETITGDAEPFELIFVAFFWGAVRRRMQERHAMQKARACDMQAEPDPRVHPCRARDRFELA